MPDIGLAPVESWPVEKVLPYPENHKKHSPAQVAALAASIKEQGLNDPITVDKDGVIISGHGRLEAVKSLGWTKVPVRWLNMLTKAQADKLRIAANKTTSTDYDFEVLQRELARLSGAGEDLTSLGLDARELEMMIGDIGAMDSASIVEDLDLAVDAFEEEVRTASTKATEDEIAIGKAFGIKKVPPAFAKVAKRFMGEIEGKFAPQKGWEALMAHMQRTIDEH